MNKSLLLLCQKAKVEPLGLMHLASVAADEGWNSTIIPADFNTISSFDFYCEPSVVGFSLYTGIHRQAYKWMDEFRRRRKLVIVGGPHASYFPKECAEHADVVVVGRGQEPLRQILSGNMKSKIICGNNTEPLSIPLRRGFYADWPEYKASPIKSMMASMGCPYKCSYCYNSMKRIFPHRSRDIGDILVELEQLENLSQKTKLIYFQDDVFGMDLTWLQEFAERWSFPYHAQTRIEFLDPKKESARKRIALLKKSGCTGLTVAIECANEDIRKKVLGRTMTNDAFFRAFDWLSMRGFKVRTEQMLGLPTPNPLEADLDTLKMNVDLRRETGLPTIAWASVFVPYKGTEIWRYCREHGYYNRENDDAPASFFEKSVLNFSDDCKIRMKWLADNFHLLALIPNGHEVARQAVYNDMKDLAGLTKYHLYDSELYGVKK